MENKEKVPSSDCDEDEDFNLLTVVNEHSEVIRLIEDDRDTNLPILNGQNGVPDSNEIEIFHPTPPPDNLESDSNETNSLNDNQNVHKNGNGDESDSDNSDENNSHSEVNEDDSEDQEHYMIYQEESDGIQNNIHLPPIPIVNYASDVEHEEDFGNGWEWTEKDPGSSCGLFISQPGLFIEPPSHIPEGFFNLLFDNSM